LWCGPKVGRRTKEGFLSNRWPPFVQGASPTT
jgi:hypothetical protein